MIFLSSINAEFKIIDGPIEWAVIIFLVLVFFFLMAMICSLALVLAVDGPPKITFNIKKVVVEEEAKVN